MGSFPCFARQTGRSRTHWEADGSRLPPSGGRGDTAGPIPWGIGGLKGRTAASPMLVIREDVISVLHDGVARGPALGIVRLRRLASHGAGLEGIGCSVVVEHGVSPA